MKLYGWLGLFLLLVSEYCLFRQIEPFYSWFYCFAWWSYILLADNLVYVLRGRSLLMGRRDELWPMLPFSVFTWLLFEGYNLVLQNWAYNGVPAETWLRWPGYTVAFATVLPGVFITADLVEVLLFHPAAGAFASERQESPSRPASSRPAFLVLGLVLSALPLIWPRYFFPAVWIGPIFLLDPLLERHGIRGLLSRLDTAGVRRILSLMIGGLACGLLWEFWNYWAASHWIYSVPFFGEWKVFQMPLLGFLGFPPFALECWILYHLLAQVRLRAVPGLMRAAFWLCVACFCILMFRAIDRRTVIRFESRSGAQFPLPRAGAGQSLERGMDP